MSKIEYVRCPRCELNYIDKREKMCKVCEAELQAKGNRELTDEEIKELNICPVCRTNYLMDEEEICSECAAEKAVLENTDTLLVSDDDQNDDKDDRENNWRAYVENDDAEVPEDEYGDMTSITSVDDEDDILDGEELDDLEKEDEFEDEFEDDFEDDFDENFEDDLDDDFEDEDDDYADDEDEEDE